MGFNWGSFFASGVGELGAVAKAKDVSVAAEAKAQAEEFVEKQEAYEDEVTKNKRLLREEADAIRGLGIRDIGKIRTVMNTYGNADVIAKINKDFELYQTKNIAERTKPKFKTLEEYIKGRITGSGTAMISDEAAEQAEDEAVVAGEELDIQQAEKKAKAQGITLDEYLQNQAIKMADRPAFNLDARAARLVEESKTGLFGKTLTLDEAKKQILGARTMEGPGIGAEARDLGETGFALAREGGLSGEQLIKLQALRKQAKEMRPDFVKEDEIETLKKQIYAGLGDNIQATYNPTTQKTTFTSIAGKTDKAVIAEIQKRLKYQNSLPQNQRDEEGIAVLQALLKRTQMNETKSGPKKVAGAKISLNANEINKVKLQRNKYKQTDEQIAQSLFKAYKGKITLEQALDMVKGV